MSTSLQLVFQSEENFEMFRREYEACWSLEGKKIIQAFERISQFSFTEDQIVGIVGFGDDTGSNYAGDTIQDPMLFRYSIRNKLGTLLHELGHRLILEHSLYEGTKQQLGFTDLHQVLSLFLYDVMVEVFGLSAAQMRVEYEKSFPEKQYRESWDEALKISFGDRQAKLLEIKKILSLKK